MAESNSPENSSRQNSGRASLKCHTLKLPPLKAHLIFWPVTLIGLAADLWTKRAVFEWLKQRGSVPVINGFLQLVLAENDGAAFGIAAGRHQLLAAVSVAAIIAILAIFLFSGSRDKLVHIALGLFAAGVCGNLWDRVFNNGLVRDFIDVVYWPGRHWPAFNVADTMLCVGVGLLAISTFFTGRPAQKHAQQHK
jgi:signal peptidase II